MATDTRDTRKWITGPPAPLYVTVVARLLELVTLILTFVWVFHNLGGVKVHPKVSIKGNVVSNDTSGIFNWHPLLMTIAFPVLMSEALLAYTKPLGKGLNRKGSKILHASLHTAAIVFIIIALVATFKSHTLKLPTPTPNLYSPHSYLGILTTAFSGIQYLAGLSAFLIPQVPGSQRAAYSPIHTFFGRVTYVLGLATMTVGIQEKTTFVQNGQGLSGKALFSDTLKIPATLLLLLALTGIFVLYHHVPDPSPSKETFRDSTLLEGTEDIEQ